MINTNKTPQMKLAFGVVINVAMFLIRISQKAEADASLQIYRYTDKLGMVHIVYDKRDAKLSIFYKHQLVFADTMDGCFVFDMSDAEWQQYLVSEYAKMVKKKKTQIQSDDMHYLVMQLSSLKNISEILGDGKNQKSEKVVREDPQAAASTE